MSERQYDNKGNRIYTAEDLPIIPGKKYPVEIYYNKFNDTRYLKLIRVVSVDPVAEDSQGHMYVVYTVDVMYKGNTHLPERRIDNAMIHYDLESDSYLFSMNGAANIRMRKTPLSGGYKRKTIKKVRKIQRRFSRRN